ncbi:MAG: DUF3795 domain-containing protein [Elusimicrobiota bacterium]
MTPERAYCGLDCAACDAFLATQADDNTRREETARKWSEKYGADIKPSDIECTGCKDQEGPWFKHCSECKVRSCANERGLDNCGRCESYPCPNLQPIINAVPEARAFLEGN